MKAQQKIQSFLPHLDPDLIVNVRPAIVTPDNGGPEYEQLVLAFSHLSNQNLSWTMEIGEDDEYIKGGKLESVVKERYLLKTAQH
ncbi:MAG: hypothetical protein Q7S63_01810 [bacterium]|nr:hypothetical protein [bacterium]